MGEVRDLRKPKWLWMDHRIYEVYGPVIGPYGLAVYGALCLHANKERLCFPSHITLAKMTKMSRRKVIDSIDELEKIGLIQVERREGRKTSNVYSLLDPLQMPIVRPSTGRNDDLDVQEGDIDVQEGDIDVQEGDIDVQEGDTNKNNLNKNNLNKNKDSSCAPSASQPSTTPKQKSHPSSQSIALAEQLAASIEANYPDSRKPTPAAFQNWAKEIDRLHRLDGKAWPLIEEVLAWSQRDPFWKQNIQSGQKFRAKWNQLLAKYQGGGNGRATSREIEDEAEELKRKWRNEDGDTAGDNGPDETIEAEFHTIPEPD